jgi:glycolate oxidase
MRRDMSIHEGVPDAVVMPGTTEEVSKILAFANENSIPVIARGAGTSVVGAHLAPEGGIVLDMCRMNRILEVDAREFLARVETGVVCGDLNRELAKQKVFFPPDPGSSSIATIGGMVNTNASGLRAVKYGTTKDYVHGLTVVLADRTVLHTGTKAPKTSTGYDLTRLFVSSEGTLGIITEVLVKIVPLPAYIAFAMALFEKLDDAGEAVTEILTSGIPLCAAEIMDRVCITVVKDAMKLDIPDVEAMLIMEVDGHKQAVLEQIQQIEGICKKHNGVDVRWSDDPAERGQMWAGRSGLVSALSRLTPGARLVPVAEDFGVPITRIPEAIKGAQEISRKNDILIATFGHVGDGNVHTTFIMDVRDKKEWEKLEKASEELVEMTLALKGTISAEHGVGIAKAAWIAREGEKRIEVARKVKQALDPKGILNPGKLDLQEGPKKLFDHFAFEKLLERGGKVESLGELADNEILICIQCGFCRAGCPTFEQTGLESRNARGRMLVAYKMLTGEFEPTPEVAQTFYECTTCKNCTYVCPSQIKTADVIMAARRRLFEAGSAPEQHTAVIENIGKTGNPFALAKDERTQAFPKKWKELVSQKKLPKKAEALLFLGCVPGYVDMKTVPSLMELLDRAGVDYTVLGEEESCCGFPVYLAGSPEFDAISKENIEKIKKTGAKTLITPCAGCYKTFKELYKDIGIEVLHSVEYLAQIIAEGKLKLEKPFEKTVAYHDPCDLGRHLGVYDPPREILGKVPGLNLVEFPRNRKLARCCGGGGGVSAVNAELALGMAGTRVKEGLGVGAEVIVSACAACKDSLKKGAAGLPKEEKGGLRILDITEVILKSVK